MSRIITKDDVKIFKGKRYLPWFMKDTTNPNDIVSLKPPKKVVIFDLDETLGSFADLYILWGGIKQVNPDCDSIEEILDLFPEFLRFGILIILEYLYECKTKKICYKIFIYTNNQCSTNWVTMIANYLEKKVKENFPDSSKKKLFDRIICAFKINNVPIEECRSSHHKKVDDFLSCSMISESEDICFIDDVDYPQMKGSKVYYICPRPYIHPLNTTKIINRMVKSNIFPPDKKIVFSESYWKSWFMIHKRRMIRRGNSDVTIDLQISKKIINHLRDFLHFGTLQRTKEKKTKKMKVPSLKKTRKNIKIQIEVK